MNQWLKLANYQKFVRFFVLGICVGFKRCCKFIDIRHSIAISVDTKTKQPNIVLVTVRLSHVMRITIVIIIYQTASVICFNSFPIGIEFDVHLKF